MSPAVVRHRASLLYMQCRRCVIMLALRLRAKDTLLGKAWERIGGKCPPTLRLQRPASNPLASADMRHQTRDSALSPLVSSSLGDLPTLAPSTALPRR